MAPVTVVGSRFYWARLQLLSDYFRGVTLLLGLGFIGPVAASQ
jgi:hypothetical protein